MFSRNLYWLIRLHCSSLGFLRNLRDGILEVKTFEVSVRDVASLLAMSGMTNDNDIVDHLKNPSKRKKKKLKQSNTDL